MGWQEFRLWFDQRWQAGEHVAAVGMTGSGKTTLAREVLKTQDFAVVFGTKAKDDSLYKPLEAKGFVRVDRWDPWEWQETGQRYVIFAPPLDFDEDASAREVDQAFETQREAFRKALVQLYKAGGWCLYLDEVRYIADDLALSKDLNRLWLQGRSLGMSIFASTQRPRAVPLNTFEMASWFFLWRIADREDRRRSAEMTGQLAPLVFETAARLPRHEFVCVDKLNDELVRSRVEL
jgi:DNA helicase HerA-like ATPase